MKPTIKDVDPARTVFPADVSDLLPAWDQIPEKFKRHNGTPWNELISVWFFTGLEKPEFKPKPGIDTDKALTIMEDTHAGDHPNEPLDVFHIEQIRAVLAKAKGVRS